MQKCYFIIITFIAFQTSQALQCNKCKDPKCESVETETCSVPTGTTKAACLFHVYTNSGATVIDKKCVNLNTEGKYNCDQSVGKEQTCDVCQNDFCNNGVWRWGMGKSVIGLSVMLWLFTRFLFE